MCSGAAPRAGSETTPLALVGPRTPSHHTLSWDNGADFVPDLSARRSTPRAPDADRVDFETTVSTAIDQIAVTSGELQREWVENGRRYFHYRAEIPITHYFAYASARYAVTRSEWNGVSIEVYHHPGHDDNVGRMIDAARKSLA